MYKNLTLFQKVGDRLFTKLCLAGPDWSFVLLSNIRSLIYGRKITFSKLKGASKFKVVDPEIDAEMLFNNKTQGNLAYRFGLKERAAEMAEIYLLRNIEINQGDVIIDCGANHGDLKLYLDLVASDIDYHAFEPSPEEFVNMKKNIGVGTANNMGLWKEPGTIEFFVSSDGADSSFIKPVGYTDRVFVDVIKLEDYITRPVKLLKLEAEGAEPEIVDGIGDKIRFIKYISADLGPERGLTQSSTLPPVVNKLLQSGFEIVDYSPARSVVLFHNKQFG